MIRITGTDIEATKKAATIVAREMDLHYFLPAEIYDDKSPTLKWNLIGWYILTEAEAKKWNNGLSAW